VAVAALLSASVILFAFPAVAGGVHVLRDSYAEVQESFNSSSGELRFVSILSPT
jgi:hypothetical protein